MRKVLIALLICLSVVSLFVACSSSPKKGCGIEVEITYHASVTKKPETLNLYGKYTKKADYGDLIAENVTLPAEGGTIKIDLPAGTYTRLYLLDQKDPNFEGSIVPASKGSKAIVVEEGNYTQCTCEIRAIDK